MALSPDKAGALAELAKHGMADFDLRGVEFDPKPEGRGLQRGMKVLLWSATITSVDASRPTVRAIRKDPAEAFSDAAERFLLIFRDGKKLDSVLDRPAPPKAAPKAAKPQPVAPPVEDDDDDFDGLV